MTVVRERASVRRRDGKAVIDLPALIDATADPGLADAYTEAASGGSGPVVLNFNGVDYINSTGIALIVGVLARARKDGRPVAATGLSDHYREIFEVTRLADFMTLYESEDSAVGRTGGEAA
jgi:anti-anti-sigma factor